MKVANTVAFNGKLINVQYGDDSGVGVESTTRIISFAGHAIESVVQSLPLAKWADDNLYGHRADVRYAFSDAPIENASKFLEEYTEILMGKTSATFYGSYSDLTGHLWTNQKFVVGGHDLVHVFQRNLGKYIHIEIVIYDR
jgi:hypothetical protein